MAFDAPYRIENTRFEYSTVYEVHRTGFGRVASVYNFDEARQIVDLLNAAHNRLRSKRFVAPVLVD